MAISICSTVRQSTGFDHFGLEQSDHGLGQGIVIGDVYPDLVHAEDWHAAVRACDGVV
ncbi:MAG: hypothetical protein JOY78_11515 [Pseudonocardia sp.]|nr:hypothetical protein [Pseudonocardia sp.]